MLPGCSITEALALRARLRLIRTNDITEALVCAPDCFDNQHGVLTGLSGCSITEALALRVRLLRTNDITEALVCASTHQTASTRKPWRAHMHTRLLQPGVLTGLSVCSFDNKPHTGVHQDPLLTTDALARIGVGLLINIRIRKYFLKENW